MYLGCCPLLRFLYYFLQRFLYLEKAIQIQPHSNYPFSLPYSYWNFFLNPSTTLEPSSPQSSYYWSGKLIVFEGIFLFTSDIINKKK